MEEVNGQDGQPNLRLLADRLLVRMKVTGERKTKSGIWIPEDVMKEDMEQACMGKVVAISAQVRENNEAKPDERVSVGDILLFSKFAGSDVKYQEEDYKVMRITDVFAVVEDEVDFDNEYVEVTAAKFEDIKDGQKLKIGVQDSGNAN